MTTTPTASAHSDTAESVSKCGHTPGKDMCAICGKCYVDLSSPCPSVQSSEKNYGDAYETGYSDGESSRSAGFAQMNTEATPSAQWDAMTDQQKIEWMAEVMGWTKGHEDDGRLYWATGQTAIPDTWNPLTDWSHWREVEEKIMENELVFAKYTADLMWRPQHEIALYGGNRSGKVVPPCMHAFTADLLTRSKALFLALHAK